MPTGTTWTTDPFGRTESFLPTSDFFCDIIVWAASPGAVLEVPSPLLQGLGGGTSYVPRKGVQSVRLEACRGVCPPDPVQSSSSPGWDPRELGLH